MYGRNLPSIFRDVFGEDLLNPRWAESGQKCWGPLVDIYDKDGLLTFEFEIPGMAKDDIKIEFHDGVLSVTGSRKDRHDTASTWFARERFFGDFNRSFRIGEIYDPKSIAAKFENGLLTVTIAKREESKPMSIKIA